MDSVPSVEVYAANAIETQNNSNNTNKRRRGAYNQYENPQIADAAPISTSSPPAPMVNAPSAGVPISQSSGPSGVPADASLGDIQGTPNPGTSSGNLEKVKKKRVRKPVRHLPVTLRKHDIWNILGKVDAGLSVSEWVALDKQAARDLVDGLRTLRTKKRQVSQNRTDQTITAVPIQPPTRGVKRSARMIGSINQLDDVDSEFSIDSGESVRMIDALEVEDSESEGSGSITDVEDLIETESVTSDISTSSIVTEGSTVHSLVNYPYNLQKMRISAPLKAPVSVNGIVFECTFDSGASVSVMNEGLANRLNLKVNGDQMHLVGFDAVQREPCNIAMNVPFRVAGHLRSEHVCIQPDRKTLNKDYCILGMTWFRAYGVSVDLHSNIISFPVSARRAADGTIIYDPNSPRAILQGYSTHEDSCSVTSSLAVEPSSESGTEVLAVSIVQVNSDSSSSGYQLNTYQDDVLVCSDEESTESKKNDSDISLDNIPDYLKGVVTRHLDSFVEVSGLGRVNILEHEISVMPDAVPIKSKPFRLTWEEQDELTKELTKMMDHGLIRPSKGVWSSPCFFVKKKDGSLRLVIDYRKLNKLTIKDNFPLPIIDTLLDSLAGAVVFSTLDAASGYWQVPMHSNSIEKTGFTTPQGTFEFLVMPFGLTSAPATFQRMMTNLLGDYIGKFVHVFIDDVICYSSSPEEHIHHLDLIFKRCNEHGLRLKFKKCKFGSPEVDYLGHKISGSGILPNVHNTEKILNFVTPRNVDEVRSFLGTTGYYRRFINNYATISAPLVKLLRKNVRFQWGKAQEEAYLILKKALTSPPVLAYPDRDQVQILTTDASKNGISAILSQSPSGDSSGERVISYNSRTLRNAEVHYSTVHLEALAVVWGVSKYRHYLLGRKFILRTDNSALTYVFKPSKPSPKLARWAAALLEYDFEVVHKPGVQNPADSLSRLLI